MHKVVCQSCLTKYKINDPSKIKTHANSKYRCIKCGDIVDIDEQIQLFVENETHLFDGGSSQANTLVISGPEPAPVKSVFEYEVDDESEEKTEGFFFSRYTLRVKFNLALIMIMALSTIGTFLYSDYRLSQQAEAEVASNGRFLLDTIEASRSFTSKVIKPALYKALPGQFIVEGMSSSFGARNIFERLQKKYPDYYFKHASPNPRNLVNIADHFEADIINNKFQPNRELKEWQGYREMNGKKDFVIMKPIVAKDRCMKCHSTPDRAPAEIISRYGSTYGFGMKSGDVIGSLSISVPATKIFNTARQNSITFTVIVFICFLLVAIVINVFFQTIVIKPIKQLSGIVDEISTGNTTVYINPTGKDEISDLARGFDRMNTSIQLAMSRLKG